MRLPTISRASALEEPCASERSPILRRLLIAPLLVLAACATEAASRAELTDLKAELKAIREENARIARRLERLELRTSLENVPAPKAEAASTELPSLTVVKLKPRQDPVPSLNTQVPVNEPEPERVEELLQATAPRRERDEEEQLDPAVGDAIFESGVSALKTGNVSGGVEKLQRFAVENPKHPKADNALYLSGLGLIGLGQLEDAATAFEQVITRHPAGDAVSDAMLKLAECRVRLNQRDGARELFETIVATYPGTSAAAQARQRLSALEPSGSIGSTGSP